MSNSVEDNNGSNAPLAANLDPEQLRSLVNKIVQSGALGRSKAYVDLLHYLCESSISGTTPKEVVIAIDVLGKDSDFDAKNDSLVRVYMHKLRQKLELYYQQQGQLDEYRLEIPVGRYTLFAVQQTSTSENQTGETKELSQARKKTTLYLTWALAAFGILLAANLITHLFSYEEPPSQASQFTKLAKNPIWAPILADKEPVLIVIGDYYIFGERQQAGKADRLVREYHINTSKDLELHMMEAETKGERSTYYNLNLFYTPRAISFVLKDIIPVLSANGKTVSIRMNSELTASDLKSNHILYIGYISAMKELQGLAFNASAFTVGSSYDELININTGKRHVSEEINPGDSDTFVDYGMLSSFPMLSGHQMMLISGTRDTGLMHMAQIVTSNRYLSTISETISNSSSHNNGSINSVSFEAFYKVIGFDGTNFDAEQLYIGPLDHNRIWGGDMMKILNK